MRRLPPSEQPTQLVVREITQDILTGKARQRGQSWWLGAFFVFTIICVLTGSCTVLAARFFYLSLDSTDDVIYEVVDRKEPVTVGATTGKAAAQMPLSPVFTPQVQFWAPLIAEWALSWEIDPNLIATVIQIESCGDPFAGSGAGAQGLFQVMPFHFDPGEDMLNIQNNARRGLAYLSGGLDYSEGHAGLALAGYNGGHSVISKGYASWYAETRRYYYWGAGIYADATNGAKASARVQEWLNAGGQSLCDQASVSQQSINMAIETGNTGG